MPKTEFIERGPGLQVIKRRMRAAKGYVVKVGVLGGELKEVDGPDGLAPDDRLTVAQVALYNEYGTKHEDGSVHVPERPAFRRAADAAKPDLRVLAKAQTGHIIDGTKTPTQGLGVLGAYLQGKIQSSIVDLKSPANAASTIKAKESSNPLINHAQLKNSVTYDVVKTSKVKAS